MDSLYKRLTRLAICVGEPERAAQGWCLRVTALKAAILGDSVVDKNYQPIKIKIAFHPLEERFEVQKPSF